MSYHCMYVRRCRPYRTVCTFVGLLFYSTSDAPVPPVRRLFSGAGISYTPFAYLFHSFFSTLR